MDGFLRHRIGGLILIGGAYTWRGLFSEFYGIQCSHQAMALQDSCRNITK